MPEPKDELEIEALGSKVAAKGSNLTVTILIIAIGALLSYINYTGFQSLSVAVNKSIEHTTVEHTNIIRTFEISTCLNFIETSRPETYKNLQIDASLFNLKIHCPWMTTVGTNAIR